VLKGVVQNLDSGAGTDGGVSTLYIFAGFAEQGGAKRGHAGYPAHWTPLAGLLAGLIQGVEIEVPLLLSKVLAPGQGIFSGLFSKSAAGFGKKYVFGDDSQQQDPRSPSSLSMAAGVLHSSQSKKGSVDFNEVARQHAQQWELQLKFQDLEPAAKHALKKKLALLKAAEKKEHLTQEKLQRILDG
jgi:hypothetical protein